MKNQQVFDKLHRLVASDLQILQKNILIQEKDRYLVFDCYEIMIDAHSFRVCKYTSDIGDFSTVRTALSWCIADKYQQDNLAQKIKRLDEKKRLLDTDIYTRNALCQKFRDPTKRESAQVKIDNKKFQAQLIKNQIDNCVDLAKYWQIRGFNNETARTGRTPSHRTSR